MTSGPNPKSVQDVGVREAFLGTEFVRQSIIVSLCRLEVDLFTAPRFKYNINPNLMIVLHV
jgi:hypothetical protein